MIVLKSEEQIEGIRKSCHMLCQLLDSINGVIKVGMSTKELDKYCHDWIVSRGGKPACLGFEGFPASTCISINDEVIHGIPRSKRIIQDGDIVSVDICIDLKGYISDSARTYMVGNVSEDAKKLVKVTEECLNRGIRAASKPGARISDIGLAVYNYATENGFQVVRDYTGHGVGLELHEDPEVPNYVCHSCPNPRLREGMAFCIEPMITAGSYRIDVLDDDWTVVTHDGKNAAHFEHTVAITKNGLEVLSKI